MRNVFLRESMKFHHCMTTSSFYIVDVNCDAPWSNCFSFYPFSTGGKEGAIFISPGYISYCYSFFGAMDIICIFAWLLGDLLCHLRTRKHVMLAFLVLFDCFWKLLSKLCIVSHTWIFLISRRARVFLGFCSLVLNKFIYVPWTTSSPRCHVTGWIVMWTTMNFGPVSASLLSVGNFTPLFSSILLGLLVLVLSFIKSIWRWSSCCLSESQVPERIDSHV